MIVGVIELWESAVRIDTICRLACAGFPHFALCMCCLVTNWGGAVKENGEPLIL